MNASFYHLRKLIGEEDQITSRQTFKWRDSLDPFAGLFLRRKTDEDLHPRNSRPTVPNLNLNRERYSGEGLINCSSGIS